MDFEILMEDKEIIVCYKPKGVVSESTEKHDGFVDILSDYAKTKIFPIHRLDKETEGIMVYAKTEKSAAILSKSLQEGLFDKKYYAMTEQCVKNDAGEMIDYLYHDKRVNKSFVVKETKKNAKIAKLEYSFVKEANGLFVYDVHLLTGRTHQIRVQFASRLCPLVGDARYGSHNKSPLALACHYLSFPHPKTKEMLTFEKQPTSKVWENVFASL